MSVKNRDAVAEAITSTLISPNVRDSNGEAANAVDAIADLARSGLAIANAITPRGVAGGRDAIDGHVESLTEAVMGVTAGLVQIASAIRELAEAVREKQ